MQIGDGTAAGDAGRIGQNAAGTMFSNVNTTGGTLTFDRTSAGADYTYGGLITGTGTVDQAGSGRTNLTGSNTAANSFNGTLNVTAGTLSFGNGTATTFGNAANAAPSAAINVSAGTLFLGTGTTIIASLNQTGGTVSAGNGGPGTATVQGNYAVSAGTQVFELGTPYAIGGANNDLVQIQAGNNGQAGNLNITGGTLSLVNATDPATPLANGLYRLYTYAGALTGAGANDGFASLSGTPSYRLINSANAIDVRVGAAPRIQFWDGSDATGATPGAQGGTGAFTTTSVNWVDSNGATPPVAQNTVLRDSFQGGEGVFGAYAPAGAATVTVSGPAIGFQRFDFTQTGYTLTGGTLTATGDTDLVNNGANSFSAVTLATPAGGADTALSTFYTGAGVTATVNSAITSAAAPAAPIGLLKIGTGTLALGGTNTYTGDTRIEAGTLGVTGGSALPDASRVVIGSVAANAPIFAVNASETVGSIESVDPTMSAGAVQIAAAQTLTFGGDNLSTRFGGTLVAALGTAVATKTGTGTFELTTASANSVANGQFFGTLNVTNGAVLVNGTFGETSGTAATVNVNAVAPNTAVLAGGSASLTDNLGKIYANVNVGTVAGDTGTLAPGMAVGAGNVATLKITGNLALGAGSTSDFDLSPTAGVRGTANDLVIVGGNLTVNANAKLVLAGTPVSGDYRLFEAGGLVGAENFNQANVSTTGAFTAATYLAPSPGTPSQINARVSVVDPVTGVAQLVQYWDGADTTGVPPAANAGPQGGNGTWNATNTNWTQEGANTGAVPGNAGSASGGDVNDSWRSQVGVFDGSVPDAAANTYVVTVTGTQNFQGLQFETAGYELTGGAINATGNPFGTGPNGALLENRDLSFLNVTAATATINSNITGSAAGTTTAPGAPAAGIWKLGAGTLVLGGTDTYQGRTYVSDGTLVVASTGQITASSALDNLAATIIVAGGSATFGSADNKGAVNVFGSLSTATGFVNEANAIVNAGLGLGGPAAVVNGPISNAGSFNVTGLATSDGTFANEAGGTLNVGIQGGGLDGNYSIAQLLTNSGTITVMAGSTLTDNVGVTNNAGGVIANFGTINDAFNNAGNASNNAGATWNADVASNTGTINNAGTWNTLAAGFNTSGIFNTSGVLNANAGGLNNTGTVNASGTVLGAINNNAGFFNLNGNLIGNNAFNNAAGATLNVGGNTYSGVTTVNNFGTVNLGGGAIGTAALPAAAFNNSGVLNSNGGTINAAVFTNAGNLSLANGTVGDVTQINGSYVAGANAALGIDVDLRQTAAKIADRLQVSGTVTGGNTLVSFFSPQFAAPSQINPTVPTFVGGTLIPNTPVVVSAGGNGTFTPAVGQGTIFATNGGLVQYQLQQTSPGNYSIVSGANTQAITPIATSLSSAFGAISTSFFQSSSAFVVPASGKGPDQFTYGPWIRVSGGAADIDSTGTDTQLGQRAKSEVDTTFEGFQAGFDSGLINVDGTNTNFHIGLTTGVVGADASEKKASNTGVNFSIPFVGVYGAVKHDDFSADVTYRHDFVDLRVNGPAVAKPTRIGADGDSVYGNLLYGIAAGKFSIIPSLGLGYSHYDIDNLPTVLGGNIGFRNFDSLLGRVGVQVGRTVAVTDKFAVQPFITGAVWHEFEGDTLARFTDPTGLFDQIMTTRVGTFGQVGVGVSAQLVPVGFTGFVRGDFRFGDKLNGQVGTMGVRYSF